MRTKIHTSCNKNGINNTNICEGYYVKSFPVVPTCYAYLCSIKSNPEAIVTDCLPHMAESREDTGSMVSTAVRQRCTEI